MIGFLPETLDVGGTHFSIRTDYRVILNIFQAFNDPELSDKEKCYVCLKCLYVDFEQIPPENLQEAIEKAYWFCDGGDRIKSSKPTPKLIDWKQDERIIFSAINKVAGTEVRAVEHMHWWTFLGYFFEIGEGTLSTVVAIRHKRMQGKKLEKGEQEFYKQNKEMINIITAEEQAEIDETKAFLKELIGE